MFLQHEPCPQCGSRNNLARYADGGAKCYGFGCGYIERATGEQAKVSTNKAMLYGGEAKALPKRGLSQEVCQKWGYTVAEDERGQTCQVANYRDAAGTLIGQKLRYPDKSFATRGDMKAAPLYGEWLFSSDNNRRLVIVEGEIDALSVSQAQGLRWPVVSIPNGAQGAVDAIKRRLEFVERFEEVVFMFDQDEPGQQAAKACAELLTPGKAKLAHLPLKDANAMLVEGKVKELVSTIFEAKAFRPDGILNLADMWPEVSKPLNNSGITYPWPSVQAKTHGLRLGEVVTFTAGSGIGKSCIVREVAHHLLKSGQSVGYIALEEGIRRTADGFLGLELNKRLHLPEVRATVSDDELKQAFDNLNKKGSLYLYDHFGSLDSDNLLARIRYMVRALGCQYVVLDHVSIAVSGIEGGDERRIIDNLMTKLRSMVQEMSFGCLVVSHLKRPEGKGHEEGARPSLAQLRGSGSIGQLSDMVLGLCRNQQGDSPNLTEVWILKNRFSGETGQAGVLEYSDETGRLTECDDIPTEETSGEDDF